MTEKWIWVGAFAALAVASVLAGIALVLAVRDIKRANERGE